MKREEIGEIFSATFKSSFILEIHSTDFDIPLFGKIIGCTEGNWRTANENKWRVVELENIVKYVSSEEKDLTKIICGDNLTEIVLILNGRRYKYGK